MAKSSDSAKQSSNLRKVLDQRVHIKQLVKPESQRCFVNDESLLILEDVVNVLHI